MTPEEAEHFHDTLMWAKLWDRERYEKMLRSYQEQHPEEKP